MRYNIKKILAIMGGFALVLIAVAALTGCGGDDPQCGTDGQPPCDVQADGGTDGTPTQQDAGDGGVIKTDGGDAGGDPCAAFNPYLNGWTCKTAPNDPLSFSCNFLPTADGSACQIGCYGHFSCIAPPEMLTSQEFTCDMIGAPGNIRICVH
ncbi:MAG: hypothetical protein WC526_04155 [Patescibacteria group bacterium]